MIPQSNATILQQFTIPEAYFSKEQVKQAIKVEKEKGGITEMLPVYEDILKEFDEWEGRGYKTDELKAFVTVINGRLSSFAYGIELSREE